MDMDTQSEAEVDPTTTTINPTDESINTSSDDNNVANQYLKQEQMIKEIAEQVKQQQSLTSILLPISCLRQQYTDNLNFIHEINLLERSYRHIRTIRGDGNCYYRAFLYSLLETVMMMIRQQENDAKNTDNEGQRLLHYITTKSWEDILQQKYDEVAIEIFHDEIADLFQNVIVKRIYNENNSGISSNTTAAPPISKDTSTSSFHDTMNEENSVSDYCTWYLRLITATYMKQDPDRFVPFILSSLHDNDDTSDVVCDIHQFCSKYIEPMGQECEHVQVLALAEAFQIHVTVVYVDGRQTQSSTKQNEDAHHCLHHHEFGPEQSPIRLTLLYRPGHYDILYKK